jgi:hypothetical protein
VLINRGMWLAFAVAVGANLHATLKAQGLDWQPLNVGIFVLVAISAPVLAFISGDVAGMLSAVDAHRQRRADTEYDRIMAEWQEDLNSSWAREKSKWGVRIEVSAVRPQVTDTDGQTPLLSATDADTDGRGHGYGQGYSKRTDARDRVRQHLEQFPDDLTLPVRELAEKVGVGKTIAAEVRREMQQSSGM